jgi:hypothetical protein
MHGRRPGSSHADSVLYIVRHTQTCMHLKVGSTKSTSLLLAGKESMYVLEVLQTTQPILKTED